MKKSELKHLIKEEVQKVLTEGKTVKIGPGKNLKLKTTPRGVEITREGLDGLPVENITIFNEELADFINFFK